MLWPVHMMLGKENAQKNKTLAHPRNLKNSVQLLRHKHIHFSFSTMIARAVSPMFCE
jgi:hypothetical protein